MKLDFDKMGGLIPAIIQDNCTGKVLMLGFMNKEDMILDGLLDYMENTLPARKPVPDEQALKEQTREELIDKVTEGIRQTAASETKFSHMLTPEEEHIMREVIREYLI
mgnify:CR=1 FL=1